MPIVSSSIPTVAEVERIAALTDPVVRNLQITQCYHELAVAMSKWTGPGANWCTFATWASRQAGQSIRGEDLMRTFEAMAERSVRLKVATDRLAPAEPGIAGAPPDIHAGLKVFWQTVSPLAAFQRTSEAVAQGNLKVFVEIGRVFAGFLAMLAEGPVDAGRLEAFLAELQPGDPPEGQEYLRRAFRHYHQALAEPDLAQRAEWLLLANLEIGWHEQTRLQPEIVTAMNAPVYNQRELRQRLLTALFPDPGKRLAHILGALLGRVQPWLDGRDGLATELQELGHRVITRHMLALQLPGDRQLWLGADLSWQSGAPGPILPAHLPELCELLAQVDPTPDSLKGSGAVDWSDLADRMHFITDFFRAFHADASLYKPPFAAAQVRVLKAGKRPKGRL